MPCAYVLAHAERRRVLEDAAENVVPLLPTAQAAEHRPRAALLHAYRREPHVERPGLEQPLHRKAELFPGHVVDIAAQLQHLIVLPLRLAQQDADGV